MRSRPHPFTPLQPNKMALPRGVFSPPPALLSNVPVAPAAAIPTRAPLGAWFNYGQNGHFARDCPTMDQARKPGGAQPHFEEAVKATTESYAECVAEQCTGVQYCVVCGTTDHVASQCVENPVSNDLAYNRWAESEAVGITTPAVSTVEDDRVLVLRPADQHTSSPPLMVTCGDKQVQTSMEPTSFDPQGRTLISIHLVIAAERKRRPTSTLHQLWQELAANPSCKEIDVKRPEAWCGEGESKTLSSYAPVPVDATLDGVDMRFDACVVIDLFSPGICLGSQELKCYNINRQEPTGEARVDECASLVVSFIMPDTAHIPLRGLVDTGSGVSILSFSAFNRIAVQTGAVLRPYKVDLYAANGKTIKTFGIVECVRFQLGGYELQTNFVVVDDAMGVEDFLLGRNFLRTYQVLVDLTAMKIVVRAPAKPVWHHAHVQIGDSDTQVPVTLSQEVVLQPFERMIVKAVVICKKLEPLIFHTVAINASLSDTSLHNVVFLEDSVATVGETGSLYVSLINLTSNPQCVRRGTQLGTVVPVSLVYQAIPQELDETSNTSKKTEADASRANFVQKIYTEMNVSTESELTSSSEFEFLSSTNPSEIRLSEREIRKRTDPELMAPIPGPDFQLQEVENLWGASACESSENILHEFDDLFMKHKADIGRCTIAKHPGDIEPGAIPHREGARRMSPEKGERANQEVRNLLALGMIQPSLSPWASGIVMVKKKNGELRFC